MIQPDYRLTVIAYEHVVPFDKAMVNPASIDLRLGGIIRKPKWYWKNPLTRAIAWRFCSQNPKENPEQFWGNDIEFTEFVLWPGQSN